LTLCNALILAFGTAIHHLFQTWTPTDRTRGAISLRPTRAIRRGWTLAADYFFHLSTPSLPAAGRSVDTVLFCFTYYAMHAM